MSGPDAASVAGTVFDESGTAIARSYADALLAAGGDNVEGILDELDSIVAEVFKAHPEFVEVLGSPSTPKSERDRLLVEVFGTRASATVVNLLRVLNRHGRLGLLATVAQLARSADDRRRGRRPVTVRSAVALDEGQVAALTGKLAALVGAHPQVTMEVDPSLIAGLVVQVGDDVYDASVRTQLSRLRGRLIERKSHAEIPGR